MHLSHPGSRCTRDTWRRWRCGETDGAGCCSRRCRLSLGAPKHPAGETGRARWNCRGCVVLGGAGQDRRGPYVVPEVRRRRPASDPAGGSEGAVQYRGHWRGLLVRSGARGLAAEIGANDPAGFSPGIFAMTFGMVSGAGGVWVWNVRSRPCPMPTTVAGRVAHELEARP